MPRDGISFLDKALHRRTLRRWTRLSRRSAEADLADLHDQRSLARELRAQLERLIYMADSRLALPRIGSNIFPRPSGSLWAWRPQLWRGPLAKKGISGVASKTKLGDEVTLYHDCSISELTLRQLRNIREEDLAPFALRLDVFRFDGSFLSLVLELPPEGCADLQRRHIIRLSAIIETEKKIEVFGRLNIKNGPNTEQVVLEIPVNQPESVVEFDLAYAEFNEKRVEKMWLDLIFEGPEMNQITIRDLNFCRYPRAEL